MYISKEYMGIPTALKFSVPEIVTGFSTG